MKNLNVMIVGVGGQGTLLASNVLGNVLMNTYKDVKVSEVHGMAQRGGSVVTYVKAGDEAMSPVIEKGEADVILAFEQMEAARWLPYLKKGGQMIVNTQKINPMPVITGAAEYPGDIIESFEETGIDLIKIDALAKAQEAGSSKVVNVVLLGTMAKISGITYDAFISVIKEIIPEKFLEMNLKAFDLGYSFGDR